MRKIFVPVLIALGLLSTACYPHFLHWPQLEDGSGFINYDHCFYSDDSTYFHDALADWEYQYSHNQLNFEVEFRAWPTGCSASYQGMMLIAVVPGQICQGAKSCTKLQLNGTDIYNSAVYVDFPSLSDSWA